MKIVNIEKDGIIYTVTFKPNWLEYIFGIKNKIKKYKDTGRIYSFGGGHVYVDQEGRELGNEFGYGCNIRYKIDMWRNRF